MPLPPIWTWTETDAPLAELRAFDAALHAQTRVAGPLYSLRPRAPADCPALVRAGEAAAVAGAALCEVVPLLRLEGLEAAASDADAAWTLVADGEGMRAWRVRGEEAPLQMLDSGAWSVRETRELVQWDEAGRLVLYLRHEFATTVAHIVGPVPFEHALMVIEPQWESGEIRQLRASFGQIPPEDPPRAPVVEPPVRLLIEPGEAAPAPRPRPYWEALTLVGLPAPLGDHDPGTGVLLAPGEPLLLRVGRRPPEAASLRLHLDLDCGAAPEGRMLRVHVESISADYAWNTADPLLSTFWWEADVPVVRSALVTERLLPPGHGTSAVRVSITGQTPGGAPPQLCLSEVEVLARTPAPPDYGR